MAHSVRVRSLLQLHAGSDSCTRATQPISSWTGIHDEQNKSFGIERRAAVATPQTTGGIGRKISPANDRVERLVPRGLLLKNQRPCECDPFRVDADCDAGRF